eukprot:1336554-Pleurochrysis_carterae.AAC.1
MACKRPTRPSSLDSPMQNRHVARLRPSARSWKQTTLELPTRPLGFLEGAKSRHLSARSELAAHAKHTAASKEEAAGLRLKVRKLEAELKEVKEALSAATEQLESSEMSHKKEVERLEAALANPSGAHALLQQRYLELKEASRDTGGRPRGHAGRAALEAKWDNLSPKAQKMALYRHAFDIRCVLLGAGCEDWLPSSL